MRHALLTALTLAIVLTVPIAGLFTWYRMPGGALAAGLLSGLVTVLAAAALIGLWRSTALWPAAYGVLLVGLLGWWSALTPRSDRDWAPDVSRQARADIAGTVATVHDVRDFAWRTETDAVERWDTRAYDVAAVRTVDIFNSYWTGPLIAHTLVSFGFADGRYLVFSIEIRRERTESYSSFAGFFRQYELAIVAADERDIVRVRSNVRREDVRLFRLRATPDQVRQGLVEVLRRLNATAAQPSFYNSLVDNCTTELFGAARAVAPGLPFDHRIIASGLLPDYLYDQGLLDTSLPLSELRRLGSIDARARAADAEPDFSRLIREGVPDPNR